MGRKRQVFTEEEKKERKREYNRRYRATENGKLVTAQSNERYFGSDKHKEYMRNYYQRRKNERLQEDN